MPRDQAFQLGADAFGVLRDDGQVEGLAEVAGTQRLSGVGEGGEDLLVGRVVRDVGSGRFFGGGRCGDVEEGLAGDAQVLALRVEFPQPGGEIRRRRSLSRPGRRAAAQDFVRRDFTADAPDQVWCGDMTEIDTGEGKLYLQP
ncbi:hypothetical protein M2271_003913 [Streptomyces sp. LBL]|uniref:hypothetical protein n=1 Tax=Streptomyces sp. LBL TaxID=2940562 RepID=UPI002475A72A|nr:hypothetical protein [Streptomyces sp. LBL]MDH6626096.1 hypothetical protein [Streptomyces sp. LBL]